MSSMSSIMLETRDPLPFPSNYEQHHKRQKGSQHCEQQTALLISQMTYFVTCVFTLYLGMFRQIKTVNDIKKTNSEVK